MSVKENVLAVLEQYRGEYISGEELAAKLGVSRSAVWKAISALRTQGHDIAGATNRGYALAQTSDKLSAQSVMKYLRGTAARCRIETVGIIDSTNTQLKRRGDAGEAEGLVLIAEGQTAGRGRIGRSFFSPEKTGLYMSILLRPKFKADQALFITTAAAVAVAKTIEEETGLDAKIKWVNDIFCNSRKVCGILTEASMDFEAGTLAYAVPGIGINISDPECGVPEELRDIVGTLCGKEPVGDLKSRLAAGILNYFFDYYENLTDKLFLEEYRNRSFLIGEYVTFMSSSEHREAKVLDIDDQARLVVEYNDGTLEALGAGEVSVRRKNSK